MRRVFTSRPSAGVRRSNSDWFSVKNGRFSEKKFSIAVKFTTRSSLSTWPKSGCSASVSWFWPFGFHDRSRPARPTSLCASSSCVAETYGNTSSECAA